MAVLLIFGALGGTVRGLLGFVKYYQSYKNVKFNIKYFISTVGLSAAVGLGAVWVLQDSGLSFQGLTINGSVALIVGYAGGDAIENVYKTILKQPILTPKDPEFKK